MKVNCWKLSANNGYLSLTQESDWPTELNEIVNALESKMGNLAIEFQQGRIGFRSLGNELSTKWQEVLEQSNLEWKIWKATENKRSLPFLLIKWLRDSLDKSVQKDVAVIVFSKNLAKPFVDNSAISISDLRKLIELLNSVFDAKDMRPITILECLELERYSVSPAETVNNKKYYVIREH